MEKSNPENIIQENIRRLKVMGAEYDPYQGIGSPIERNRVEIPEIGFDALLPTEMQDLPFFRSLMDADSIGEVIDMYPGINNEYDVAAALNRERFSADFEFWAATCASIMDKDSLQISPFILRKAQRKLLLELEKMRLAGVPIYVVLLKARQWGGSTLVQMYMMWIQQIHKTNWHLAVCAQDDSAASNISEMYNRAADYYPKDVGSVTLLPYARSPKNRYCKERGGIIGVGSINNPKQFRSYNYPMIHISEAGSWEATLKRDPEELAASLMSAVPSVPYSLIVIESTAKGVGNYFHRMWQKAESEESAFKAVFVAWWEIENYQAEIQDYPAFIKGMKDYDWFLWDLGATLEGINWYNTFRIGKGYSDHKMMEEFPSTSEEAFIASGQKVYNAAYIQAVEKDVCEPEFIGDITGKARMGEQALKGLKFEKRPKGSLAMWGMPDKTQNIRHRYCFFADIGGRTDKADWSVLRGMDRIWMMDGEDPEFVLTLRTHLDQDLFAWKCAQICMAYAIPEIGEYPLLAVETNSLKKEKSEGDHFLTVLSKIAKHYPNIYIRNNHEKVGDGWIPKYGFFTGHKEKGMIIDAHNASARERYLKETGENEYEEEPVWGYVERDMRAVNEMKFFETKADGTMGAIEGQNDDIEICTAGGIWLATEHLPMPFEVKETFTGKGKKKRKESDF